MTEILIDGSMGEGGGQVLRTSLALSIITGRPLRIRNIRSGRRKPGLLRQHLTAVKAAAEICGGELRGADMGSTELAFRPGPVRSGRYTFAVGTAGSAPLVLQTVLPPLLTADGPSALVLEGGTHNPKAPPFEFLEQAFLPLVRRMGPDVTARLERPGFYPAGGGRFEVDIAPVAELQGFELHERGEVVDRHITAKVAKLPLHIAERQIARLQKRLGWPDDQLSAETFSDAVSPGSVLLARLDFEHVTEVFVGFGEVGVRAERVAEATAKEIIRYRKHAAPVGEYLADQLMLPLALARNGSFTTRGLSLHARTQFELIPKFLDLRFALEEVDGNIRVRVEA